MSSASAALVGQIQRILLSNLLDSTKRHLVRQRLNVPIDVGTASALVVLVDTAIERRSNSLTAIAEVIGILALLHTSLVSSAFPEHKMRHYLEDSQTWQYAVALLQVAPFLGSAGLAPAVNACTRRANSDELRGILAALLLRAPELRLAAVEDTVRTVVDWLNLLRPDVPTAIALSQIYGKLLTQLWTRGAPTGEPDSALLLVALHQVFYHLSAMPPVSPFLSVVLTVAPPACAGTAIALLTSTSLAPVLMAQILWRVLTWPPLPVVVEWALQMLKAISVANRVGALQVAIELALPKLAEQADVSEDSFTLFESCLLGYQHRPTAFHQLLPYLRMRLEATTSEKKEGAAPQSEEECGPVKQPPVDPLLLRYVRLTCTLMHAHPGHPELYDTILPLIPKHLAPSPEDMDAILAQHVLITRESYAAAVRDNQISLNYVSGGDDEARGQQPEPPAWNPKPFPGLTGLVNLGNTCYMNAMLQALFLTADFREGASAAALVARTNSTAAELGRLFCFLRWTARESYVPRQFSSTLPSQFRSAIQQDASEFGKFLFDRLESDLRLSPTDPANNPILAIFGGTSATSTTCANCCGVSRREESFLDLSIGLPENPSGPVHLADLLATFFAPEALTGSERYACEKCNGLQDASRAVSISRAPRHLMLTINRFRYSPQTGSRQKLATPVECPFHIQLAASQGVGGPEYELYAMVVHSGSSAHHGHYYCVGRPSSEGPNAHWYVFNDSSVRTTDPSSLTATQHQSRSTDVPYILFFRRIDQDSPVLAPVPQTATLMAMVAEEDRREREREQREWRQRRSGPPTAHFFRHYTGGNDDDLPPGPPPFGGNREVF